MRRSAGLTSKASLSLLAIHTFACRWGAGTQSPPSGKPWKRSCWISLFLFSPLFLSFFSFFFSFFFKKNKEQEKARRVWMQGQTDGYEGGKSVKKKAHTRVLAREKRAPDFDKRRGERASSISSWLLPGFCLSFLEYEKKGQFYFLILLIWAVFLCMYNVNFARSLGETDWTIYWTFFNSFIFLRQSKKFSKSYRFFMKNVYVSAHWQTAE